MKLFVEEAHEDMVGAGYASDSIKASLQTRWQQRISMLRGVESYVSGLQSERELLIEQARSVPAEVHENLYAMPDFQAFG